ncbi:MAG: hypothetical protein HYV45_02350 [Candidatus Moranbacteria bacterium]|nr:hypothetical protein [Candidatus Moranbacteria bacterium]
MMTSRNLMHNEQSKSIITIVRNKMFFVTFIFLAFSSGLFWLDTFRGYRAEMEILVIAKGDAKVSAADMASDVAFLVGTLSLYDRLILEHDRFDPFEGEVPDERREEWNDMVSVRQTKTGGLLHLRAIGESTEEAKRLARQTSQTLFSMVGLYYKPGEEIDIRVIDGPFSRTTIEQPVLFVLTSVLTGLAFSFLFFLLLELFPLLFRREKKERSEEKVITKPSIVSFSREEILPFIDPKKFIPTKPEGLAFEHFSDQENRDKKNNAEGVKKINHSFSVAPAPANLPVVDATAFSFEEQEEERAQKKEDDIVLFHPENLSKEFSPIQGESLGFPVRGEHAIKNDIFEEKNTGEPTVEEYKRRLNELLAGTK